MALTSLRRATGVPCALAALVPAAGVAVEDAQDVARAALCADGMRKHRGELRGLIGLYAKAAVAQQQDRGAGEDNEPFVAGMGTHARRAVGRRIRHPLTHDRHARVRPDGPSHQLVGRVDHRAGDDIVGGRLDELIERGVQGAGEGDELVQSKTALTGLDPTERGGTEPGSGGQVVKRPALCHPQRADPFAYQTVELTVTLRHKQYFMPYTQAALGATDMAVSEPALEPLLPADSETAKYLATLMP